MRYARHCALAAGLLLAAAACSSDQPSGPPPQAVDFDYRQKHPLIVEPTVALLQITAQHGALAAADRRRVEGFAAEYVRRGDGVLEVSVGGMAADDSAARAFAQQVAGNLLDAGLKSAEVRLQLVIDDPDIVPGRALLRFASSTVQLPECDDWSSGTRNAPSPNFGCSMQHNIGAMVANPRDLVQPRPVDARPGLRGSDAIEKLNQGQAPWSVPLPFGSSTQPSGSSGGH
jgi:pilus assembly protein CpaD